MDASFKIVIDIYLLTIQYCKICHVHETLPELLLLQNHSPFVKILDLRLWSVKCFFEKQLRYT